MKAVFCRKCQDIVKLQKNLPRVCDCGDSGGFYFRDGLHAVYFGEEAIPIGIDNHKFIDAIYVWTRMTNEKTGPNINAFLVSKEAETFRKIERSEISSTLAKECS